LTVDGETSAERAMKNLLKEPLPRFLLMGAALFAGMTAAVFIQLPSRPAWLTCVLTIGLGVLVAADLQWPVAVGIGSVVLDVTSGPDEEAGIEDALDEQRRFCRGKQILSSAA
jgi:hypothetical protein